MNWGRPLLITGGHIVDPSQGIDDDGDLLVTDGKIAMLGRSRTLSATTSTEVLDASGLVVCPGFIDLHCHLRQPGFEKKETIATGTFAAAHGGFTTVCCMPNTNPPLDSTAMIDYVKTIAEKEGVISVLPIGCITTSRKGKELVDMAALADCGAAGFSDDGSPVMDHRAMKLALIKSRKLGLLIIDHCENLELSQGGQLNDGETARKLALRGIPAAAEETMVERDIRLAQQTGGRLHIAHVSTSASVDLIRQAKLRGVNVTAEVTPHHLTLTEEIVFSHSTQAKVNPPLRTEKDVAALIAGVRDNTIDAIATDHAPHTLADKECPFDQAAFGISGFETALGSVMELVHRHQLSLFDLILKLTIGPARVLGDRFDWLGSLAPGRPANLTVFDPLAKWIVDPNRFTSKGRNTPLAGTTLKGKVMATIYQGRFVYRNAQDCLATTTGQSID